MLLGSSCSNIAENSTFARPLDFACRLSPSFHAFAEACATETLGAYHVRRRFLQAVENGYGKAEPLLKIIQELYQIERVAKERAEKKGTETALFQERKNARRQSQKFVREFFEQCRVLKESERPTSLVAQAVSYALNIEEELKKFLKDARLNIDNNPAERLNRGIAIIRKNCLFAGNEAGGQRLAILYSFAATCKANGICFRKWLEDVLPRLNSTPAGQIDSLIPEAKQSCQ